MRSLTEKLHAETLSRAAVTHAERSEDLHQAFYQFYKTRTMFGIFAKTYLEEALLQITCPTFGVEHLTLGYCCVSSASAFSTAQLVASSTATIEAVGTRLT